MVEMLVVFVVEGLFNMVIILVIFEVYFIILLFEKVLLKLLWFFNFEVGFFVCVLKLRRRCLVFSIFNLIFEKLVEV